MKSGLLQRIHLGLIDFALENTQVNCEFKGVEERKRGEKKRIRVVFRNVLAADELKLTECLRAEAFCMLNLLAIVTDIN